MSATKTKFKDIIYYICNTLFVGWEKNYDDLLRKNANIRGRMWKNGGKEEIFIVPGWKISFWKRGGGNNINYFDNIHPCICINVVFVSIAVQHLSIFSTARRSQIINRGWGLHWLIVRIEKFRTKLQIYAIFMSLKVLAGTRYRYGMFLIGL